MHIGNKIKEEVAKRNISVTDFAKLINKSRPYTYSIFEKENIDRSMHRVIKNKKNNGKFLSRAFLNGLKQ